MFVWFYTTDGENSLPCVAPVIYSTVQLGYLCVNTYVQHYQIRCMKRHLTQSEMTVEYHFRMNQQQMRLSCFV